MANEKQLIYVNTLVKDLELLAKHEDSFRQSVILGVVQTVKAHPTVDAVEVVRCRDCKHMILQSNIRYCTVWHGPNGMGDDGFCNYGERKDGDGNG